jgi:hypothetical protein
VKKVYRIYILETGLTSAGVHDPFKHVLDRHGARDYQSYEEAEELLSLERELVRTSDPQRVLNTVKEVRQELRELFRERREKVD